jgi:hypothetical protein
MTIQCIIIYFYINNDTFLIKKNINGKSFKDYIINFSKDIYIDILPESHECNYVVTIEFINEWSLKE